MRAAAGAVLLVLLAGCSADEPEPTAAPKARAIPELPAVVVQTLPSDLASLPRLPTALPRRVPTDVPSLPALMDDLPGRATAVYHPPERWPEPVEGWASETLLFHGVDGQWRRLRMDELGLPEASWGGHDTHGAGDLSPDGRRWADSSRDGVILLDLRTGQVETIDLGWRWTASVEWRADSRSLVLGQGGVGKRADVLELPSRRRTPLPYDYWQASEASDGTAYSLKAAGRGRAELITWHGDEQKSLGEVAIPGLRAWDGRMVGPDVTDGRFLFFVQRAPYRVIDLVVVSTDTLEVEARLHLSAHDRKTYRGSSWLDSETVLLETGPGLIAWRPASGEFYRLTSSPTPRNGFATLVVAADLAVAPDSVPEPEWDPRDVDELPMVPAGLPDVIEPPKTAPALADHPVQAAVLAVRRAEAVLLLGPDGTWRSVAPASESGTAELTDDGTRLAVEHAGGVEVWDLATGERTSIPVPDGFRDWDYVSWKWIDNTSLLLDDLNPGGWRVDTRTGAAERTPYPANRSVWGTDDTVDTDGVVLESRRSPRPPMLVDWSGGAPRRVDLAPVGRLANLHADRETVVGTAYQNGPFSVYVVDRSDAGVRAALPIRDTDGNYSNGGLSVVALLADGTVLLQVSVFGKHPSWRLVAWDPYSGDLRRVARGVGEVSSYARSLLNGVEP